MAEDSTGHLQQWIARLNAGEPSARDELLQRSVNRLRRLVRHSLSQFARLRRFEETDDVLHAVIIRLMRRLELIRPPTVADFFRLAATEVRHSLIDLTRKYFGPRGAGTREARMDVQDADGTVLSPMALESTDDTDCLANWEEFHRQIEKLPAEESDVFAMIWYNDLRHDEVAAALGVSTPTVKRRWLSAKLKLQRWIEETEVS